MQMLWFFFQPSGLLPRDKPKAVTVRDVKKRESVRKDNRRRGDGSFDGSDTMEGIH